MTRDDTKREKERQERQEGPELFIGRDTPPSQLLLEAIVSLSECLVGVHLCRKSNPADLEVLAKCCESHFVVGCQVPGPCVGVGGLGRWQMNRRIYIGKSGKEKARHRNTYEEASTTKLWAEPSL